MSTSPTERSRRRDPNRKQAILKAAADLISRHGYAGTSMAEIGAEVGIATSANYWHFPGKQQLLLQLFDQPLNTLPGRAGRRDRGSER